VLEPVHCYRELIIELGEQRQMISIRVVQLLIISIYVKMRSNYKVGQVIEKNIKKQGSQDTAWWYTSPLPVQAIIESNTSDRKVKLVGCQS